MLKNNAVHVGEPQGPIRAGAQEDRAEPVVQAGEEFPAFLPPCPLAAQTAAFR